MHSSQQLRHILWDAWQPKKIRTESVKKEDQRRVSNKKDNNSDGLILLGLVGRSLIYRQHIAWRQSGKGRKVRMVMGWKNSVIGRSGKRDARGIVKHSYSTDIRCQVMAGRAMFVVCGMRCFSREKSNVLFNGKDGMAICQFDVSNHTLIALIDTPSLDA